MEYRELLESDMFWIKKQKLYYIADRKEKERFVYVHLHQIRITKDSRVKCNDKFALF